MRNAIARVVPLIYDDHHKPELGALPLDEIGVGEIAQFEAKRRRPGRTRCSSGCTPRPAVV